MSDYSSLLVERAGATLVVTVNRPGALNAINRTVMAELGELFREDIPQREGLRAVIITGAGDKAFVAGADIKEFASLTGSDGRDLAERGQRVFDLIERCGLPVIAAVNGYALGAGCELAMACHLRVASERARFGQPEVKLGLLPGYGGTQRLVQLIGRTKALELLLTADMIDAATAERLGLVNYVVAPSEVLPRAHALADAVAALAPIAIRGIIEAVNAGENESSQAGYAAEVHHFGKCALTKDFREGAAAFVEKRAPTFVGQ